MANGPRSIYSRRQRMAPGQYDNPLADFLDRLPDYFNDYQRNQLALERQQLADKRYEEDRSYRQRQEERAVDQQNIQNLKYVEAKKQADADRKTTEYNRLVDQKREEDELITRAGLVAANKGNYDLAENLFKGAGKDDIAATFSQMRKDEQGMESGLSDIKDAFYGNQSPYKIEDMINNYREKYNDKIKINDTRDQALTNWMQSNSEKVAKYNKGFLPLKQWPTSGPDGQRDFDEYDRIRDSIEEDTKVLNSGQFLMGKTAKSVAEDIKAKEGELRRLEGKYKTETREQYNYRTKAMPKMFGALSGVIPSMPNLASGQGTDQEYTISSDESLADMDVNDAIGQKLTALQEPIGPQPDSSIVKSTTPIQDILNMPSAQAQPQTVEQDTTKPADLQLGETISTQPTANFDVKDISEIKNNMLKNPQTARKLKKDIGKLKNLINEMSTLSQLKDERSRNFRKKQLDEGIEVISNKIKKQYGDFINPNTGEFSSEEFSNDFFSVLSRSSNTPQDQLKQLFKGFSTAKPVQQAI